MNVPTERRALVTGGGSGLSSGIAAAIAADGFSSVTITHRRADPASTLRAIESRGARAHAAKIDFSGSASAVQAALEDVVGRFGPFDTLVHGVGALAVRRFERFDLEAYDELFDANVRSAVLAARTVLPYMRAAGFGRVVVFAGNGSAQTQPHPGLTLYQASKSALVAFAKALALEEAHHGITINAIEPGDIREKARGREAARATPSQIPRGRPGSVDDVADVVRFLVAADRDFVTGAVIAVTGGLTAADERNATRS